MNNYAIILASGTGERSGLKIPKQFALIQGKTILEYSIDNFNSHPDIKGIILVSNPDFLGEVNNIINKNHYSKILKVIPGGKTRQESSYIGICAVEDKESNVLIHDAVRPFAGHKIISECISALNTYKAVNVATESADTIIEVDDNNIITKIPKRRHLKRCQTPQCFYLPLIKKAHEMAINDKLPDITDDCGLILKYQLADIYVANGSDYNIKITYPLDLEIADLILNKIKKESI